VPVSSSGAAGIIRPVEYTSTGRLKTISIAGRTIPCTQLRQTLGLPSTDLTWEVSRGKIVFHATGNGHGVGMSQYGAKGMAMDGCSYEEIVLHYYTDVKIKAAY
jgi:stage II sporulation protein D